MKRWIAVGVAVVALILPACERPAESVAERVAESMLAKKGRHSEIEIDRASGSIVVRLKGAVKPARWPGDVPFFGDVRRARADEIRDGVQRLTLSGGDAETMESFYRERLEAGGWALEAGEGGIRARRGKRELVARFEPRDPVRGARAVLDVRSKDG